MNKRTTLPLLLLATIGFAACGSDTPAGPAAAPATTAVAAPTTAVAAPTTTVAAATTTPAVAGSTVVVKAGSSEFGQILVDPNGNTLYAFTNDTAAQPTCTGTCAEAWPPAIVDASWTVAPGLDAGVFATVVRDDGTEQLVAGKFPLYRFSGDARPGDVNGQGSGGVWFVVDTNAALIEDAAGEATTDGTDETATDDSATESTEAPAPAIVAAADNPLGSILVGADGRTLYGFTPDDGVTPTCVDGCATAWPPVIVDPSFDLTTLPNAELYSTIERADGSLQLKAGKWPLYSFSGDAAPGETNGQGSGGKWFVAAADGTLIK